MERQNAQLAGELSQSKEKSEQAQAVIRDLQEQLSYLMEELESEKAGLSVKVAMSKRLTDVLVVRLKVAHANLDATDFQDAAHQVNDLEHSARLADELSKSRAECLNLQEQLSRLQDEHAEITEHMAAGEASMPKCRHVGVENMCVCVCFCLREGVHAFKSNKHVHCGDSLPCGVACLAAMPALLPSKGAGSANILGESVCVACKSAHVGEGLSRACLLEGSSCCPGPHGLVTRGCSKEG